MKYKNHLLPKFTLLVNSSNVYSPAFIDDATYTTHIHKYTHSQMLHGKLSVGWCLGDPSSQGGMHLHRFWEKFRGEVLLFTNPKERVLTNTWSTCSKG